MVNIISDFCLNASATKIIAINVESYKIKMSNSKVRNARNSHVSSSRQFCLSTADAVNMITACGRKKQRPEYGNNLAFCAY